MHQDQPTHLFRFRNCGASMANTLGELRGILFFADNSVLNDPFDPLKNGKVSKARFEINSKNITVDKHWCVVCFSEEWSAPVMWAHYAGNYSGICIKYSRKKIEEKVNSANLSAPNTDLSFEFKLGQVTYDSQVTEGMFSKNPLWEYEKEWRLLGQAPSMVGKKNHGAGVSHGFEGCIEEVYIGPQVTTSEKNAIRFVRDKTEESFQIRDLKFDSVKSELTLGNPWK